jgi:hypothetical protein
MRQTGLSIGSILQIVQLLDYFVGVSILAYAVMAGQRLPIGGVIDYRLATLGGDHYDGLGIDDDHRH